LNPDLSAGNETAAPIISPIPVSKKGGIPESSVAREANDAQRIIAPRVNRSAFIPKVYGTKVHQKSYEKKSKNKKYFQKNTPYTPVMTWIGVYLNPVREWKDTKE
jgi:hypothetical protein